MELNKEQIIKALECCTSPDGDDTCLLCPYGDINLCTQSLMARALSLINELTEENGRLRAKGEWEFPFNDKGDTWVNCSQCTVVIPKQEAQTYKYCPYCGAKMKGE